MKMFVYCCRWPSTNTSRLKALTWPWRMRFCSYATRSNLAVHVRVAAGSSPNRGKMGRPVLWLPRRPSMLDLARLWCHLLFQDLAHRPAVRHRFLPFQVKTAVHRNCAHVFFLISVITGPLVDWPFGTCLLGASTEQLSVSLAVEASEGLNEFYWQGIETSALAEMADLPHESSANANRRHSLDVDRNARKPTSQ